MHKAGAIVEDDMAREAAGITAALQRGVSVTLVNPSASEPVYISVSGVCTADSEIYAGKCISEVFVDVGSTVTVPIQ